MLDDQVGALFERDVLAEQRHDLLRHVEVVEDRRAAFVQLDDLFLVRGDHPDVFADLLVHGVVVDVYAAERPVEQVADDRRRAVFLVQDQRRGRLVAQAVEHFFPATHERRDVVLDVCVLLAHRGRADDDAVILGQHGRGDPLESVALLVGADFLRDGYLVREGNQHDVASSQRDVGRQARTFGRYGLFGDLRENGLAAGYETRNLAGLAHRLVEAYVLKQRSSLPGGQRADELVQRGELRAQIEIMDESVLLIPDVDERGVQAGHDLLDFPQVDVADGVSCLALFLVQLDQLLVLEQGDGDLAGGYVDN